MQSFLMVNLSSVLSTIQISYPPLENGSLMTDDWKWVLRTASSTRPVTRCRNRLGCEKTPLVAAFSDTRGIFQVSAGDGSLASGAGGQVDLGPPSRWQPRLTAATTYR